MTFAWQRGMLRGMLRIALAAAVVVGIGVIGPRTADAARAPRPAERAAINQEIASFFWRKHRAEVVAVRRLRISTVAPEGGWNPRARYYMRDAAVATVEAADARGNPQQVVDVLLGRYMAQVPRWTVLAYGNAVVGCQLPLSTFGRDLHFRIFADLKLACP